MHSILLFLEYPSEDVIHSTNDVSEEAATKTTRHSPITSNDHLFQNEAVQDTKLLELNILTSNNEQNLSFSRHNVTQNGLIKTLDFGQKPQKEILPVKDTKASLQRKKTSRIKCLNQ